AGIAAVPGGDAIDINAPGATVVLRGLTLLGANAANAGIHLTGGSRLEVIDCTITDFVLDGIVVAPTTAASVLISNTIVADINPSGNGVGIFVGAGGGPVTVAVESVTLNSNAAGFVALGAVAALIADSHIDNNTYGIDVEGTDASHTVSVIAKQLTLNDN